MCVYVKLNNKKSENPAIKLRERERERKKSNVITNTTTGIFVWTDLNFAFTQNI